MLARIQAHEVQLVDDPTAFFPPCCPACQESGGLRVHEFRRREFWFVLAHRVQRVRSLVMRVTCRLCSRCTTVLPDFALPHKRYLLQDVVSACERFLLDEDATYRSASQVDERPAFHNSDGASRAPSTVHRWVGFLGSLVTLLGHATELVLEANPAFSPLAEMLNFSPCRYCTEARRELLGNAHRLLRVRAHLQQATQLDLFPRIATSASWT